MSALLILHLKRSLPPSLERVKLAVRVGVGSNFEHQLGARATRVLPSVLPSRMIKTIFEGRDWGALHFSSFYTFFGRVRKKIQPKFLAKYDQYCGGRYFLFRMPHRKQKEGQNGEH